jgi:tetratricopeptide (TPR) repeat protein
MRTVAQALAQAVRQHQAGQLEQAERIYRAILQVQPQQVDALHLLGLLAYQVGQHAQARACIGQALRLRPDFAEAHYNLGNVLRDQGQLAEAQTCYRQALRLKPDYAKAHYNLGNVLKAQGQLAEAQACYQQALHLEPVFAEAHYNLGVVLHDQGQLAEAQACYQQALRLKPDLAAAHNNLGHVLHKQGRLTEAQASYQQALRYQPDSIEAHYNLGVVLQEQGQLAEAQASYERALRLKPDLAAAHNNLGHLLQEQEQLEEARACYQQAVRLQPDFVEAYSNLGSILPDLGQLEEARACLHQALRLKPDSVEAHNSLGNVLQEQGKFEEALASYQEALRLQPDYALAHWNRALAYLLAGDFEQGWREYEWRWQLKELAPPRFPQPLWDGSPLHGQTILLYGERGFGDTIQFIRYAPLVQARGGYVVVACEPELVSLLARCPGIDRLLPHGNALPPFDVYVSILTSLPGILGMTLATIPAQVPYVFVDAERIDAWRQELSSLSAFKIGIAWDGDPKLRQFFVKKCIPLAEFAPLGRLEGVRLFGLQKGPATKQLQSVAELFPVTDLSSRLETFVETAAVIQNLDLVITADVAVAHLAGALGVPVWVALCFVPDWRWQLEREDSPWYPTMRLFRQKERGNWAEVFTRITAALQQRLAQGSGDSYPREGS